MWRPRLLVLGLLALPAAAAAQEFGVVGGLTLANINVTGPGQLPPELQWCCSPWNGTRHDMTVGLYAGIPIKPGFAVTADLLFTRRGFSIGPQRTLPGARLRMSYVEVPVQAQVVGRLVRMSAGPTVAFATSSSQWSDDVTRPGPFINPESLAKVDVALTAGASAHLRRFSIEGRYVHGLRNVIRHAPAGASLRQKSLMLLIRLRLAGPGSPCEEPPAPIPPWRR